MEVADTGVGFDPYLADALFEKFTTWRRKGTRGGPTTGLGLYMSSVIAGIHGGVLTAQSDGPDRGARFFLRLPLASFGLRGIIQAACLGFFLDMLGLLPLSFGW